MSAHVLLNLLNDMGKKIKCEACRAHACRCNKAVIVWLCACTGDNPLAKARG